MSRVIAAIIFIALLFGLCITDFIFIGKSHDKFAGLLLNCEQHKSEAAAEEMYKEWVNSEPVLSVFVNHAILEDVSENIAKLPALTAADDSAELLAECAAIRLKLKYIKEDSRVNLHSLF